MKNRLGRWLTQRVAELKIDLRYIPEGTLQYDCAKLRLVVVESLSLAIKDTRGVKNEQHKLD